MMSHSITVTRTTTTGTAIILNTGFFKTVPGLLKLFETIIGAVCLGLVAYYGVASRNYYYANSEHTCFFIVTFAFLVTTFLLLLSALLSLMAATILPKTLFESLYHLFAFIFYLSSSVAFLIDVAEMHKYSRSSGTEGRMAAAVLGLVNSVLYFLSTFFSYRAYRSG